MIKIPISRPRVDDRRPRPRRGRSSRITRARVDRARRSFRARTREVRLARGLFFPPFPVFRRLSRARVSRRVARLSSSPRSPADDATRRDGTVGGTKTDDDERRRRRRDERASERTHETRRFIFPSSVVASSRLASRVGARGHRSNLSKRSRTVGRGGFVLSSVTTRVREREDA